MENLVIEFLRPIFWLIPFIIIFLIINNKIMQTQKLKEKIGYSIINRESEIDNLIMWINESKNDYDKSKLSAIKEVLDETN